MHVEELNEKLREKFYSNKNYKNLEQYVMSELLSPIEDYYNAVKIIYENIDLIEGLDLLYIAAYLNSEYLIGYNQFLEALNSRIEKLSDKEKSIVYFLNANEIICNNSNWRNNKDCVLNLVKSVQLSKDFNFVNNRYYLSQCNNQSNAKALALESLKNVQAKYTSDSLQGVEEDVLLSTKHFIDEFILGVSITEIVYQQKESSLIEKGLI